MPKKPAKRPEPGPTGGRARDPISDRDDRRITEAAKDDPDNPPLGDAFFERARPAREVVAQLVANPPTIGRPRQAVVKRQITLRLDPEIIDYFRATGKGWQARINDALRRTMKRQKRAS